MSDYENRFNNRLPGPPRRPLRFRLIERVALALIISVPLAIDIYAGAVGVPKLVHDLQYGSQK